MKIFKNIVSFIATIAIINVGSLALMTYLMSEISFTSGMLGVLGVVILLPAFQSWEKRFDKILNNEE